MYKSLLLTALAVIGPVSANAITTTCNVELNSVSLVPSKTFTDLELRQNDLLLLAQVDPSTSIKLYRNMGPEIQIALETKEGDETRYLLATGELGHRLGLLHKVDSREINIVCLPK